MAFYSPEPSWAKRIVPELELLDDLQASAEIWNRVHHYKRRRALFWLGLLIWPGPFFWALSVVVFSILPWSVSRIVFISCSFFLSLYLVRWWDVASFWLLRKRIARLVRVQLLERGVRVCLECGHDLRGQEQMQCPECGWRQAKEPAV